MVHRLATGIVQAKDLSGQGQRVPAVGIHEQEFFFNTKSTHTLSVTDENDKPTTTSQHRRAGAVGRPQSERQPCPQHYFTSNTIAIADQSSGTVCGLAGGECQRGTIDPLGKVSGNAPSDPIGERDSWRLVDS